MKTDQTPAAPKHLRQATRRWFDETAATYVLQAHHMHLLVLAAEARDRAEQAREALAEHGTTFIDRFGSPHARPEVAIERDSRLAFARLLRELALDTGAPDAPRPPRVGGAR